MSKFIDKYLNIIRLIWSLFVFLFWKNSFFSWEKNVKKKCLCNKGKATYFRYWWQQNKTKNQPNKMHFHSYTTTTKKVFMRSRSWSNSNWVKIWTFCVVLNVCACFFLSDFLIDYFSLCFSIFLLFRRVSDKFCW